MKTKQAASWSVVIAILMALLGCSNRDIAPDDLERIGYQRGIYSDSVYYGYWLGRPINLGYVPQVGVLNAEEMDVYGRGYMWGQSVGALPGVR